MLTSLTNIIILTITCLFILILFNFCLKSKKHSDIRRSFSFNCILMIIWLVGLILQATLSNILNIWEPNIFPTINIKHPTTPKITEIIIFVFLLYHCFLFSTMFPFLFSLTIFKSKFSIVAFLDNFQTRH